jgi:hypothetical protein
MVVRQVPKGDRNDEILQALTQKGYQVIHVHGLAINKGTVKSPSTTVALEFIAPPPPENEILLNGMVFRPEKQTPSPYRCKKFQKLGHTDGYCSEHSPKCPNCGFTHDDTANCTSPPNCVNCKGNHPSSSLSCHHNIRWKTNRSAASHEAIQPTPNAPSFSEAAKKSLRDNHPNHEVEILRWKIESLQTEMAMVRAEIATIRPLEEKVSALEESVNNVKRS